MKKLISIILLLLLMSQGIDASAQKSVFLYLNDHTKIEIAIGDKLKLSYVNNNVYIKSSTYDWEYSLSEFERMSFNETTDDIERLDVSSHGCISVESSQVTFRGFAPSDKVTVHSLLGQKEADYAIGDDGCLSVQINDYPAGTYLFTINHFTYKLIKK